jgi:LysM repeat protein
MKRLRLFVPVAVIAAVLLLIAPAGALAAPNEGAAGSGCVKWHYVRCGQTLASIARTYGTSVSYLAAINGIANPNRIYAGTSLCVRKSAPPPKPRACGGFWYTVKCGDTLNKIGARYGWSAAYLAQVNHNCNPNLIYAGQKLWIPGHGHGC